MTAGHGAKLARMGNAAIEALLTEATIGSAARRVGVGEKTLRRWLRDAGFASALAAEQRRRFETELHALQAALPDAVTRLRAALAAKTAPSIVRAALGLIDLALRATSLVEVERRVARLESTREDPADRWSLSAALNGRTPSSNGGAAAP